jgi:hypothetical protein
MMKSTIVSLLLLACAAGMMATPGGSESGSGYEVVYGEGTMDSSERHAAGYGSGHEAMYGEDITGSPDDYAAHMERPL